LTHCVKLHGTNSDEVTNIFIDPETHFLPILPSQYIIYA
jgi:hypothetical protein